MDHHDHHDKMQKHKDDHKKGGRHLSSLWDRVMGKDDKDDHKMSDHDGHGHEKLKEHCIPEDKCEQGHKGITMICGAKTLGASLVAAVAIASAM